MPARCRSNCTVNKTPVVCNAADKCSYTNGAIRKYCRLSSKYKMNKPNCNITRKFLKREKGPAEKIRQFLERKHASRKRKQQNRQEPNPQLPLPQLMASPTNEQITEFTNKVHTRRLERFMRKLDPRKLRANVRARYLNGVCSDSGVCIAFGKHVDKIKKHFDGFVKFNHVKSIKKIGAVSANGFVKELEYERAGYKAHAVLKSATKPNADNLYYEYLAGLFANKESSFLPNFVETYGVYKYNSNAEYKEMKKLTATKDELSGLHLIRIPAEPKRYIAKHQHQKERNHLKDACENSNYMCVLIQHINGAQTLKDKCQSATFVKYESPFVLFQIYYALYALHTSFTHYDLHADNVLIYEPVKDSYIHYFYHLLDGSVVSFKSSFIAKMIDYGRSYYDETLPPKAFDIESNSKSVYDTVCNIPECDPNCGSNVGFEWFELGHNISSQQPNLSQDLRLLSMLHNADKVFGGAQYTAMCKNVRASPLLKQLCAKVVFDNMYDTQEEPTQGYPVRINNVTDAYLALKDLIQTPTVVGLNMSNYDGLDRLGEMHIYMDNPLEYIPTV